jgi:pimeloyl-ACP methyl ester carboxylesterase
MYIFASIFGFFAALLAAGFLYQWIGAIRDRSRYAGRGRWVKTPSGSSLYVLEQGDGGPTVLFEAGIAATNLNWTHIQQTISETNHTISYDRAGLGWSSPALSARIPGNIARELHVMLAAAGIKPPYVLVGHSFGGLVMRRYALLFPEDVAGIVLVDPMRCEEWPPLDPSKQATIDRGVKMTGYAVPIAHLGLARLAVTSLLCRSGRLSAFLAGRAGNGGKHVLSRVKDEVGKMPEEVWPVVAAHWSRPSYYVGMAAHISAVPDTVREMLSTEPVAGIPITLLTPGKSTLLKQSQLDQIGDNVQQIVAPASAHWIHLDEPDIVIDAIREMAMAATPMAVSMHV